MKEMSKTLVLKEDVRNKRFLFISIFFYTLLYTKTLVYIIKQPTPKRKAADVG